MQLTITGRHVELTPALRAYAEAKVEKLLRFNGRATSATVTVSVEHADHEVEIEAVPPRKRARIHSACALLPLLLGR